MANAKRNRRVAIIECCGWHEETLFNWVYFLERLGYSADLYARNGSVLRELGSITAQSPLQLAALDAIPSAGARQGSWTRQYDLMVLNTLVNEAYYFPPDQGDTVPTRSFITRLDLPSISYIHEPDNWTYPSPLMYGWLSDSMLTERPTFFYGNGSCICDNIPGEYARWEQTGNRIRIVTPGSAYMLESPDGGPSYRGTAGPQNPGDDADRVHASFSLHLSPDTTVLDRWPGPDRHRVLTTCASAYEILRSHYAVRDWLIPLYLPGGAEPGHYREPAADTDIFDIIIPAEINYERKNFRSLIDAAGPLQHIRQSGIGIVGGARGYFDPHAVRQQEHRFSREAAACGLDTRCRTLGYLSYRDLYRHIGSAKYLMPLIDNEIAQGSYCRKLSASITHSLAFNVPLIINDQLAALFGLDFMIVYPGTDLASGIEKMLRTSPRQYREMKHQLAERCRQLAEHNTGVLSALVEEIN